MTDALQRLVEKDAIRDLMARYARGVDRGDWDLVRSTYFPDAWDDHGDFKGGTEEFIAWVTARTRDATQVMHFLGQCLIELAKPDVAVVETHFMTAHTLGPRARRHYKVEGDGDTVQISSYGRYVDRVEKRGGEWRIARRIVVIEATRVAGQTPPLGADWARQRRDGDDPIFQLRREAGL